MRLDRAGSIGLRVGPLQIAPKIHKKRVRNPARDSKAIFYRKMCPKLAKWAPKWAPKWHQNEVKGEKRAILVGFLLMATLWAPPGCDFSSIWSDF